jgi:hypothetical protein
LEAPRIHPFAGWVVAAAAGANGESGRWGDR